MFSLTEIRVTPARAVTATSNSRRFGVGAITHENDRPSWLTSPALPSARRISATTIGKSASDNSPSMAVSKYTRRGPPRTRFMRGDSAGAVTSPVCAPTAFAAERTSSGAMPTSRAIASTPPIVMAPAVGMDISISAARLTISLTSSVRYFLCSVAMPRSCGNQLLDGSGALPLLNRESAHERLLDRGPGRREPRAVQRRRVEELSAANRLLARPVSGNLADDHFVDDDGKAVHVRSFVEHGKAGRLFGTHVARRAQCDASPGEAVARWPN